jgi:hypothetical protein
MDKAWLRTVLHYVFLWDLFALLWILDGLKMALVAFGCLWILEFLINTTEGIYTWAMRRRKSVVG